MALRTAVLASLPVTLLRAAMAPGCGCEVSHCCDASHFNNSQALAEVFNGSLPSYASKGYSVSRDRAGHSAACGFLNLVPGFFDENGTCSDSAASIQNTTVCEAVAASAEASDRLHAGRSILSVFLEPGTCAEGGACWESREGVAAYEWDSFSTGHVGSWCQGLVPRATPALAWSTTCPSEGGLSVRAKWVDGNATGAPDGDGDACSRDYSGGIQATLGADGWMAGSDGSPRWQCFDVPRGDMGPSDVRILVYSVGDLPCVATTTTTTTGAATTNNHTAISGSLRTSLAAFAHAAAATAAVGAMM
mmetsp:Transcript_63737/g.179414  ORF Transcript_63737/g.179414 Transcript_63737/m.179414 type:complete len:305 (+) Transcript_63737:80-994(+)